MASKVRATLSGVTVSCEVISFDVDLVPATRAKADKRAANSVAPSVVRICPTCEEPTRIKQLLVCDHPQHHHGPFTSDELGHATEVDGELVKFTPEDVPKAKTPTVDAKSVAFSVFPASEVERATLPSGNIYRMRLPAKATKSTLQAYALMRELVADSDLAFIAELVVKGVSKLYRASARGDGMITLAELMRPSLFHEPDGADATCDERTVAAGRKMVAAMVAPFDPTEWESAAEERLKALQAAVAAGVSPEPPTAVQPASAAAEDLLDLLRSAA